MTPERARDIHLALEEVACRRISETEFGELFGITKANASRAARSWKSDGPTGPVAAALEYLAQGLPQVGPALPAYAISRGPFDMLLVVRLRFPRFMAAVGKIPAPGAGWIELSDGMGVKLSQCIDLGSGLHPQGIVGLLLNAGRAALAEAEAGTLTGTKTA